MATLLFAEIDPPTREAISAVKKQWRATLVFTDDTVQSRIFPLSILINESVPFRFDSLLVTRPSLSSRISFQKTFQNGLLTINPISSATAHHVPELVFRKNFGFFLPPSWLPSSLDLVCTNPSFLSLSFLL